MDAPERAACRHVRTKTNAAKIRVAADNSIRLASSRFPIAGMNRAMNSFEVSLIARAKEPAARARNAR
jgi:hypothetical protein